MASPTLTSKSTETEIDTANKWLRSTPWYQDFIRSIGQDPSYVHLNDAQKKQFAQIAAANGLPLPSNDEIDPAGNINPKGHKMRNFLIAAAVGGAALGGAAALGAFSGAGGAGAAGAGGALGATSTVPATGALAAGGLASGAVPAALAAGAGGASVAPAAAAGGAGLGALGWASLLGGVGSNIAGSVIQGKAESKATDAQERAAKEALEFSKGVYEKRRADLDPYIQLGSGSVAKLSDLMGIAPKAGPATPPIVQPTDPNRLPGNGQNFPASMVPGGPLYKPPAPAQGAPLAGVGAQGGGGGVQMIAPDGSSRLVPEALVVLAESRGAKRAGVA